MQYHSELSNFRPSRRPSLAHRPLLALCAAAIAAVMTACGGDSTTGPPPPPTAVGSYALESVDGKAPPDTVVRTDTSTVEFLDGTLTLRQDSSYKLLFHSRTTIRGMATSDTSGSSGTYSVSGSSVTIRNATDGDSVVATLALPRISFTDGGELFVFKK